MPSDDFRKLIEDMGGFGANPFAAPSSPAKAPKVRIKLNNQQYRKLRSGEELEYKIGESTVLLVLPTDVRDVVERTS